MRIISKQHDYYDSTASHGVDMQVVYVRNPSFTQTPGYYQSDYFHVWKGLSQHYYWTDRHLIGFCGKIYPTIGVGGGSEKTEYFYTEESLIKYWERQGILVEPGYRYNSNLRTKLGIKQAFEVSHLEKHLENLFHEHKSPIFVYGKELGGTDRGISLNPLLRPYQFYKIKDPVTAFQDIYMYISGVLGINQKPMVKIDDKYKIAAKGHDGEYSFRKPPGKRGNPQWR